MRDFLGKTIKSILWGCLLILLGAFLFGLLKFKGNIMEYIQYLNSIGIQEIFVSQPKTDEVIDENFEDDVLSDEALEQELSGLLTDDGYFLPEAEMTGMDDTSFGFSGSLDTKEPITSWQVQPTSVSKEDLVNLIKSREQ